MTWLTLHPWAIVASPFLLAGIVLGVIHGCEAWAKWRDKCALRIRDERLQRYNLAAFRGTKERLQ